MEELEKPTSLAWSAPVLTTKLGMRLLQGRGKLTRSFSSKWSQIFLRMLHFDTSVKHTHIKLCFNQLFFFLWCTSSLQTITALILKALQVVCSLLLHQQWVEFCISTALQTKVMRAIHQTLHCWFPCLFFCFWSICMERPSPSSLTKTLSGLIQMYYVI